MPFLHDVDPGRMLAQARFRGVVTEDDLRCCLSRVWSDPRWSRHFSALIDLSGATELRISPEFLRHFASVVITPGEGPLAPRTAVVAPLRLLTQEDLSPGSEARSSLRQFRLFSGRVPALNWVDPGREAEMGGTEPVNDPGRRCIVRFHPAHPLLHLRFDGIVRGSELRGLRDEVVGDPRWSNERHILADLTRATSADLHSPDLIRVAMEVEQGGRPPDRGKLACLAPGEFALGILQRFRGVLLAFPRDVRVLRRVDETLDWLGLPLGLTSWLAEDAGGESLPDPG